MRKLTAAQSAALTGVDARAAELSDWCAAIFDFAETAWREYRSCAWYVDRLRNAFRRRPGILVERVDLESDDALALASHRFDTVTATSTAGTDTAFFYGTTADETYGANPNYAYLLGGGFAYVWQSGALDW